MIGREGMIDENVNEWFKQYKETGDIRIRNKIAEKYLYIAEILAKKFIGRGVEYDDLVQIASMALVKGIDRFDIEQGNQFSTFITPTITGEIKNYFRDKSRLIKTPRKLNEIAVKVKKFALDYEAKQGKKPSVLEIAQSLGFSQEEVVNALEISGTVSLDSMVKSSDDDGENSLYSLIANTDDAFESFETKEMLRSAIRDFTELEQKIIRLRYVDELSQSATAKKLGVSQMYISRLERKVLLKLKEKLQEGIE